MEEFDHGENISLGEEEDQVEDKLRDQAEDGVEKRAEKCKFFSFLPLIVCNLYTILLQVTPRYL